MLFLCLAGGVIVDLNCADQLKLKKESSIKCRSSMKKSWENKRNEMKSDGIFVIFYTSSIENITGINSYNRSIKSIIGISI